MKNTRYLLLVPALLSLAMPLCAAVDDAPFQELKTYDFQRRKPVETINRLIRTADAATQAEIEGKLLAVAQDPATTFAAQAEIGKMLWKIGTVRSVPVLAKWLPDEKLNNVARFGLERIADPLAGKTLREALPGVTGKALIGVINSIGERRDADAVKLLKPLAIGANTEAANAAIAALGKIGTRDAVFVLQATPNKSLLVYQSLLVAANGAASRKGGLKEAQAIYRPILDNKTAPLAARLAAARGLLNGDTMQAAPLVLELLRNDEADLRAVAARFVHTSDVPTRQLTAGAEALPASGQALLLVALADRNDPALLPVLLRAGASTDADVRRAALRAFAPLQGNADAVLLLAKAVARGADNTEKDAARYGLYAMRGKAVDEAIVAAIPGAESDVKRELVNALGQRYSKSAKPLLFQLAGDSNLGAQDAALNALGEVAANDDYAAVVKLLLALPNNNGRGGAENMVSRLAKQIPIEADRTAPLLAGLAGATVDTRISLLKVLAGLGGTAALDAVRTDVQNADPKIQEAAIRALSNSPDPGAMPALLDIAGNNARPVLRVLSLRGYLRLAEAQTKDVGAKAVEIYAPAVKLASEAQEKKTIISGLSKINSPEALTLIVPWLDDENVRGEAALAALGIAKNISGKNPQEVRPVLEKIVAVVKDDALVQQANETLQKLPAK